VIDPYDYDDILVTVEHPWSTIDVPLLRWIETGPGPRPFVRISGGKRFSTGEAVPLSEIPLEYHNCRRGRELQRRGELPMPWGPPPEPELPPLDIPPHLRHLIDPDDC
jgi:hypothetical protein